MIWNKCSLPQTPCSLWLVGLCTWWPFLSGTAFSSLSFHSMYLWLLNSYSSIKPSSLYFNFAFLGKHSLSSSKIRPSFYALIIQSTSPTVLTTLYSIFLNYQCLSHTRHVFCSPLYFIITLSSYTKYSVCV